MYFTQPNKNNKFTFSMSKVIFEVNIRDSDGDRFSSLFSNSYLWVELQLLLFIFYIAMYYWNS